ncbi:oligosaccharyltransferase complex subunit (non-catalytic) [Cricetulus griseus]
MGSDLVPLGNVETQPCTLVVLFLFRAPQNSNVHEAQGKASDDFGRVSSSILNVFIVLECPNLKLKKPPWVHMPSAMTVYALVVVSYFLITGGIIYDVIVEPPSVGSMTDEHGHQRPVAFLAYRVNGQYIMEGLASSFLFTMGGLGFIILDRSNAPNIPKLNRFLLLFIGFVCVLLSFFMARVFMRMKLPGYLMG